MTLGSLYIVSAPSGAGKTSLIKALLESVDGIEVSVSHTTRAMREGETNGQHYHFVDVATFEKGIGEGLFLEYAKVFENYYGTSRSTVQQRLEDGVDVILEIDWQGAQQIRQLMPDNYSIFILPPSIAELEQRLTTRNQDAEAVIARRISQAREDVQHYVEYDHIIVNDDFNTALQALSSIFESNRTQRNKVQQRHSDLLNQLLKQ
ncbi:MAG: guanylate kinase [Leucothrix sp.]